MVTVPDGQEFTLRDVNVRNAFDDIGYSDVDATDMTDGHLPSWAAPMPAADAGV